MIQSLTYIGKNSGRFRLKACFKKTSLEILRCKPNSELIFEKINSKWYNVNTGEQSRLDIGKEFTSFQQHCDYEQLPVGYTKDYV